MPPLSPLTDAIHRHHWGDGGGLNAALAALILSVQARDPGVVAANVSGWHSTPDLLRWPHPAIARFAACLRTAADARGIGDVRAEAWANVMRTGAFQLAHRHGQATWAGVYYVAAGAGPGGAITFARGAESVTMHPEDGLMLTFPGQLLHSVSRYEGSDVRISIGFNLS